jgi:hypothetical protein
MAMVPTFDPSKHKSKIIMNTRQLFIDFDLYTHDDPDFKSELIGLMLKDVLELQSSLYRAAELNDISIYKSSCHKVNSTLTILDDQEFISVVGEIKQDIKNSEKTSLFHRLCSEIVNSLKMNQAIEVSTI